MAIYCINHTNENNKIKYCSIELFYNSLQEKFLFNSGDFLKDWYDFNFFKRKFENFELHFTLLNNQNDVIKNEINSKYDVAFLSKTIFGEFKLEYKNKPKNLIMKLYVPKGMKLSWKEFLNYINK